MAENDKARYNKEKAAFEGKPIVEEKEVRVPGMEEDEKEDAKSEDQAKEESPKEEAPKEEAKEEP